MMIVFRFDIIIWNIKIKLKPIVFPSRFLGRVFVESGAELMGIDRRPLGDYFHHRKVPLGFFSFPGIPDYHENPKNFFGIFQKLNF